MNSEQQAAALAEALDAVLSNHYDIGILKYAADVLANYYQSTKEKNND